MNRRRSGKMLWWGLGLVAVGLSGVALYHTSAPGMMAPFSGWGGGGVYDKGSYASNGERLYYLGIDEDGKRLKFSGGPHWLRTMGGSCVNCHGPDGRGGMPVMMGTHIPGDIRYETLVSGRHHGEGEEEMAPYTDKDIARAVRLGLEPSGESMDRTMPRWNISDRDMGDLIEFLKTLR